MILKCHGCGTPEGQKHKVFGCDFEWCPTCGKQISICGCLYRFLGFPGYRFGKEPYSGLPKELYEKGPSDEQWAAFQAHLEPIRVPFILWPGLCGRCGVLWPDMFMVPDNIWHRYVTIRDRNKMLCLPCFRQIVTLVDADPDVLALLDDPKVFLKNRVDEAAFLRDAALHSKRRNPWRKEPHE